MCTTTYVKYKIYIRMTLDNIRICIYIKLLIIYYAKCLIGIGDIHIALY